MRPPEASRSRRPVFFRPLVSVLGAAALLAGVPPDGAGVAAQETQPAAAGREPAAPSASRWSVDDLLFQEEAGQFRISPDGRHVAWVRSRMDRDEGREVSNLWLTRIEDGQSWALTRGTDRHYSPRWSPDGRLLAFGSTRDLPAGLGGGEGEDGSDGDGDGDGPQLWVLRLAGGEPWPVTRGVRGLGDFAWKGERSDSLVFVAQEAKSRFERERERTEDDAIAVEDTLDAPPTRLWGVEVSPEGPGDARRLTTNDEWIRSLAVSPDGRRAVVNAGRSLRYQYDQEVPPVTYLVELESGEMRRLALPERTVPYDVQWEPGGGAFLFAYEHSSHPFYRVATIARVGRYDLAADSMAPVDLDWPRGLGGDFHVVPDGFVAFLADGTVNRPARYERSGDGWRRRLIEGDPVPHVWDASVSQDGRWIAYERSRASEPAQPYVARLDGSRIREPGRLDLLNPSLAAKQKPRTEVLRWVGARGDTVEGILYYPLDWREGRPWPAVVSPHGGPASRDVDAWVQGWHDPYVLYNQQGAFVFRINYHGSAGYGLEWVESIAGEDRYYALPRADIEAGVDLLVERGLVHPDSIAAAGWSNGAILTAELITEHPERYRVAIAGAGDVEWISDWANVDFGASFDEYYFGASPLEDPQHYIDLSPYFELDRVRAPTLIFFGTEDRNVPPSQGWNLYRALQQLGNVETRFVLFPGEPHGLRQYAHQRRKVEEELRWLDRHLWGREWGGNLALAPDAPLNALLGRSGAARTEDGRYGVERDGVLVPETVERRVAADEEAAGAEDGAEGGAASEGDAGNRPATGADAAAVPLQVGRFEVTRAQFAAFDSAYAFSAGTGNHPANGISFQRARAYAAWLAERTGEPWRLPSEAELSALQEEAEGGVTLDWWAGYTPNPEDVERLRRAIEELEGEAPLLREVGSYAADAAGTGPAGMAAARELRRPAEPLVFDLGGNVAEWAVAEDGSGVPLGASADRPRDEAARPSRAAPEYTGLRVVKGAYRLR